MSPFQGLKDRCGFSQGLRPAFWYFAPSGLIGQSAAMAFHPIVIPDAWAGQKSGLTRNLRTTLLIGPGARLRVRSVWVPGWHNIFSHCSSSPIISIPAKSPLSLSLPILVPILEIKHLSKKYKIQAQQPYLSLRETLFNVFKPSRKKEEFWALNDLSFDVMPGDTLGIIGRNGAGKSTLLKILSKITPPTKGGVTVRGRIASLLEVGTGFHPELTGRENIFLNGSILGMKRSEIKKQFDAILDFAGVEKFIDTPLKHYSSGMQLRLAFAVAAFLEPEILIIDEVLAVGDSDFQKKCLGKMKDVSEQGRTVLLVSHDLTAISNLTQKTLYLRNGCIAGLAGTDKVIEQYVREGQQKEQEYNKELSPAQQKPQIVSVKLATSMPNNVQVNGETMYADIELFAPVIPPHSTWLSFQICDSRGRGILHVTNGGENFKLISREGYNKIRISFPTLRLYMGNYHVNVFFAGPPNAEVYERLYEIISFEVLMAGQSHEFGWAPDACTYMEDCEWQKD